MSGVGGKQPAKGGGGARFEDDVYAGTNGSQFVDSIDVNDADADDDRENREAIRR